MIKDKDATKAPVKTLTLSDLKNVAGGFGINPHSLKGEQGKAKLEIKPN
jgi:hypothetical protein